MSYVLLILDERRRQTDTHIGYYLRTFGLTTYYFILCILCGSTMFFSSIHKRRFRPPAALPPRLAWAGVMQQPAAAATRGAWSHAPQKVCWSPRSQMDRVFMALFVLINFILFRSIFHLHLTLRHSLSFLLFLFLTFFLLFLTLFLYLLFSFISHVSYSFFSPFYSSSPSPPLPPFPLRSPFPPYSPFLSLTLPPPPPLTQSLLYRLLFA